MFRILDGREHFYQWDSNCKLIVDDSSINEVHFCNRTEECSLVCEVFEENGVRLVNVPNILLQDNWKIRVYAFYINGEEKYTKVEEHFEVLSRTKPADYVYTETEVKDWETFKDLTTKDYVFNLAAIDNAEAPKTGEKIVSFSAITSTKKLDYFWRVTVAEIDTETEEIYQIFNMPLQINPNTTGLLDGSTVVNAKDYTAKIKSPAIGLGEYGFEWINEQIASYVTSASYDTYSFSIDKGKYRAAQIATKWTLVFANDTIRDAFKKEFSPVVSSISDIILQHTNTEKVDCVRELIGG